MNNNNNDDNNKGAKLLYEEENIALRQEVSKLRKQIETERIRNQQASKLLYNQIAQSNSKIENVVIQFSQTKQIQEEQALRYERELRGLRTEILQMVCDKILSVIHDVQKKDYVETLANNTELDTTVAADSEPERQRQSNADATDGEILLDNRLSELRRTVRICMDRLLLDNHKNIQALLKEVEKKSHVLLGEKRNELDDDVDATIIETLQKRINKIFQEYEKENKDLTSEINEISDKIAKLTNEIKCGQFCSSKGEDEDTVEKPIITKSTSSSFDESFATLRENIQTLLNDEKTKTKSSYGNKMILLPFKKKKKKKKTQK